MKKTLLGILTGIIILSTVLTANAYEPVYNNYQVVYNPTKRAFSTGGMVPSRIVLTKKTSSGSGSYSEYYAPNGSLVLTTGGNFEFVDKGKLISVHNADLKYYEIIFDHEYKEIELSPEQIQKYFPETEIIKISEFKNNEITVSKLPFKKKTFLLYNDTNTDFYKYSSKPKSTRNSDINGLLNISYPMTIKFSHYDDDTNSNPTLKIHVKNNY